MVPGMDEVLRYRGRAITAADLDAIRALLAAHPDASRRALSQRSARHWDWRQPNGALRDMVGRSLLLALHRAGHITLPPVRQHPNPLPIAAPRAARRRVAGRHHAAGGAPGRGPTPGRSARCGAPPRKGSTTA